MSEEKVASAGGASGVVWKKGAVLVMDALGVKGAWARSNPSQLVGSWRELVRVAEERASMLQRARNESSADGKNIIATEIIGECALQAMSDTLTLVVQPRLPGGSMRYALAWLVLLARSIFINALRGGIYFRGVISCGEFYGTPADRLLIGPAVDEAVDWYTRPDWIGVSTAPSAFFEIERAVRSDEPFTPAEVYMSRWLVPMRGGKTVDSWVLDWPWVSGSDPPDIDEKELLGLFASKPIGPEALSKYTNTLEFFRGRKAEMAKQAKLAVPLAAPTPVD